MPSTSSSPSTSRATCWARGPRALGQENRTPSSLPGLEQIATAAAPLAFLPRPEDYTGHYVQLASRVNAAATTTPVVAAAFRREASCT